MLPLLENFHPASQYSFRIFYLSWKIFVLPVNILSELGISWNDQAGCISFFVKSDNSDGDEICVGTSDGKHDHELLAPKVMNNMVMKTGPSRVISRF